MFISSILKNKKYKYANLKLVNLLHTDRKDFNSPIRRTKQLNESTFMRQNKSAIYKMCFQMIYPKKLAYFFLYTDWKNQFRFCFGITNTKYICCIVFSYLYVVDLIDLLMKFLNNAT